MMKINFYNFSLILILFFVSNFLIPMDTKTQNQSEKLLEAMNSQDCEEIKKLVDQEIDLDAYVDLRGPPLSIALFLGLSKSLECLLSLGANPYTKTHAGNMLDLAKEVYNHHSIILQRGDRPEKYYEIVISRKKNIQILEQHMEQEKAKLFLTHKALISQQIPTDISKLICEYSHPSEMLKHLKAMKQKDSEARQSPIENYFSI